MVPAYEGKNPYIFVSYAHKDSSIVLPIINMLYEKGYRVWYDEGIAPGSEWPKNIADHLNNSLSVIYFVSNNSIASPNCENEVRRGINPDKRIIEYSINNVKHNLLSKYIHVDNEEALLNSIDDSFIGDGSGYDRNISGKKYSGMWNAFIYISIFLVIALGLLLFGLNKGWFDRYLPQVMNATETADLVYKKENKTNEAIEFSDDALVNALATQVGKEDLYKPVEYNNEAEKAEFINSIGYNQNPEGPTYYDLTTMDNDKVWINYATDHMLSLFKYMPNIKEISIADGEVTDLSVLSDCNNLETVNLDYRLFPVNIPDDADFKVMVLQ